MCTLLGVTVFYCFALDVMLGQITLGPKNMASKVGQDVPLRCVGKGDLKWEKHIGGDIPWQTIVNADQVGNESKYAINTVPDDNYELTIKSVILNDARGYRCKTIFGVEYAQAELIVFESDPVCQNNMTDNVGMEGDPVEWSCEVGFKGTWAPAMEWSNATGIIKSEYQNTSDIVKSSFVMILRPSDDGRQFSCRTFFDEPKPGSMGPNRADNIILTGGLFDVYTSPVITVNYGPVSLAIESPKDSYFPGEYIKITVDSRPYPDQFKWSDNTTGTELGVQQSLMLTEAMIGKQSLRVSVCNTMPTTQDTVCKEQQFFITVKPIPTTPITTTAGPTSPTRETVSSSGGSSTPDVGGTSDKTGSNLAVGAIVGIVLGVIAFLVILILIFIFVVRGRKSPADEPYNVHMDSNSRRKPVPVDQVRVPDIISPYGRQDNLMMDPNTRTPSDVTYADLAMMHDNQADLAIDDVPRSRKPLQVFEPGSGVDYASIQPSRLQ